MGKFKVILLVFILFCSCEPIAIPIVKTIGFSVDEKLTNTEFESKDFKIQGYSQVVRYKEIDGRRDYVLYPTPETAINDRDTMSILLDAIYLNETRVQYFISLFKESEEGNSCEIIINTSDSLSFTQQKDTLLVSCEILIKHYSDINSENEVIKPDSSYISFNKIPYCGTDSITGFVYVSLNSVFITGLFMVKLD